MNYKKIGLLVVAVSVLLNAFFLKDYVFKKKDDTVKVEFECRFKDSKKDEVSRYIETYRFKDNKIYSTYQSKNEGSDYTKIIELEDCVIIDSQNWSCGGKFMNIAYKTASSPSYVLNNGRFTYSRGYLEGDENPMYCKTKQLD
jgi:hypothetical protein